jgi:hypothetical protein
VSCSIPPNRGDRVTTLLSAGTPCDTGDWCSVNAQCDGAGRCITQDDNGSACLKNRYITLSTAGLAGTSALRVTLSSLHRPDPPNVAAPGPDLSGLEGEVFYVGPPADYQETESPPTSFRGAILQCAPYYQDWSTEGPLHITGAAIVPSSTYLVEALPSTCMGTEDECTYVTARYTLATSRWGDVVTPFQAPYPTEVTQPDIRDVNAVVRRFNGIVTAPIKARSQLQGNDPNPSSPISIVDVANTVDGFKSFPYPYSGPSPCP